MTDICSSALTPSDGIVLIGLSPKVVRSITIVEGFGPFSIKKSKNCKIQFIKPSTLKGEFEHERR